MTSSSAPRPTDLGEDRRLELPGASAWLWWTSAPPLAGEHPGVIGRFRAADATAARRVLEHATALLREQGCTLAIGPMDGNTWRSYRFVTDAGSAPPFLLEPRNPPEYPAWWEAAGFAPLAQYHSTATEDLAVVDPRVGAAAERLAAAGVTVRALSPDRYAEDLAAIHDVSVESFRDNYLYTPLARDAFVAQYAGLRERLRPELVLLAEQGGRAVGYVFAIPDLEEPARGAPLRTAIVKTLAVRPGRAFAGLGAVLLARVHAAARDLGLRRAVHALMHESNRSRNLSAHYGAPLRRYTLYARRLAGGGQSGAGA
jgi:GNAT superfamily N-acetyltransferase